jgi:hypothetical protein
MYRIKEPKMFNNLIVSNNLVNLLLVSFWQWNYIFEKFG